MAMKKIEELRDKFVGPKMILFQSATVDLSQATITLKPDMELPVEVDTLKATMDDPTINHYKVIGQAGDWATTAEMGDFNVEFVVPSKAKDLLSVMFGAAAVADITKATATTGDIFIDDTKGYSGVALELTENRVSGTVAIVDKSKENIMVITNLALYCTMVWDDTKTKPVAFKFSGSVEGAGTKSVAWLTKVTAGG